MLHFELKLVLHIVGYLVQGAVSGVLLESKQILERVVKNLESDVG